MPDRTDAVHGSLRMSSEECCFIESEQSFDEIIDIGVD
jgi:hypothetical protein